MRTAAAYIAFSVCYTFFFSSDSSYLGAHLKIAPILLLAFAAWTGAAANWRGPLTAALLFSALGDLLLDLDGLAGDLFVAGLGSFLTGEENAYSDNKVLYIYIYIYIYRNKG
jgi:uncharacterized membrane protein YhhN